MTSGPAPQVGRTRRVRVALPHQLRVLAGITQEAHVEVAGAVTLGATIDALERTHPELFGTIRDPDTGRRRAMIRIFADGEDLSDAPSEAVLPAAVTAGQQPLRLVGAIAGGA